MSVPAPHFLLFSSSQTATEPDQPGQWRFVLEAVGSEAKLEVSDSEPQMQGERLELLAVVRGLEALDQPSRVTLVTPSRYVARGISSGLTDWRENGWQWERHGEMAPIRNRDLWQRVDRALGYHRVECRQVDGKTHGGQGARDEGRRDEGQALAQTVHDRGPDENVELPRKFWRVDAPGPAPEVGSTPGRVRQTRPTRRRANKPERTGAEESSRRRQQRTLRRRRQLGDRLAAGWLRFRQLAAPLVRPPWLD